MDLIESIKAASADSDKSFRLAINGARRKSKRLTQQACANEYNVSEERIGKDITVRQAVGYAYSVIGRKRKSGPSLIQYGAAQNSSGLTVTVSKRNGQKRIRSGFIRKGSSGNLLAFVRRGAPRVMKMGRYAGKVRQPIKALLAQCLTSFRPDLLER